MTYSTNSDGEESVGRISRSELLAVQKPGQYLGGEHNSILKDPSEVEVRFALAFPDLYEVGMSHVGIQLLYEIINSKPEFWAERAFMPMADMEALLREKKQSLTSLESKTPLGDFDFIGFSLQYELCSTNLLNMLDLSGIPLWQKERDLSDPLVIGGGPYTYHPEPVSDFFDLFFLGDAEEAIEEILRIKANWNKKTEEELEGLTRKDLLLEFAQVEGIYVPSLYEETFDTENKFTGFKAIEGAPELVTRRLLQSMEGAPYLKKPIVPNIETVHNRLSVEVMRGCVRGCRFCQAGYLYRPQRERSPQEIVEIIGEALPESGYEELSLLSLSTADYCSVVPLLKTLMDTYAKDDKLAVSFPSTRVDSLTPEVLEQVQRVRRTGFTIAPEGGTQRMRDVINKGVSDDQIIETCTNVFKMGWSGIKLYFMLGLPTETDEDLEGIINIADRLKKLPEAHRKDITVSVSTHVPKPHTPFQWAQQISAEETIRKQRLLAEGLKKAGVNFRYHNAFASFLEGVFCRGDRQLSKAIFRAWELGCRLDAWCDHLDREIWMQAFEDCGINPHVYLHELDPEDASPWDHLSCGIPKDYFLKEWKRSIRDRVTPDCLTQSCSICGACDYDQNRNVLWPRSDKPKTEFDFNPVERDQEELNTAIGKAKFRICYSKSGRFALIGHLELAHVFHRAARRAGVPLSYSRGFHPHPKLIFGPPLQLGIESEQEYLDASLSTEFEAELLKDFLNQELPEGLDILSVSKLEKGNSSLGSSIAAYDYRVEWIEDPTELFEKNEEPPEHSLLERINELEIIRPAKVPKKPRRGRRFKKPKDKVFAVSEEVSQLHLKTSKNSSAPDISFRLRLNQDSASLRATEFISKISGLEISGYRLIKTATIFSSQNLQEDPDEELRVVNA